METDVKPRGLLYRIVIFAFFLASKFLRQKPHIEGEENLKNIPTPVLFTITHDSYFEVPSLSRIYYALKPKPDFLIMAKNDFLNGRYLSTNFTKCRPLWRKLLLLIDRSGLPLFVFRRMNLKSIERPFIEKPASSRTELHQAVGRQLDRFKESAVQGVSSLIFPEGTTWGFGGLKRIRSAVYQVVESSFAAAQKRVFILPVNVKVDRLVQGRKDVFIQIGRSFFMYKPKEEFNRLLFETLQHLHTITFSQVAALYVRRVAEMRTEAADQLLLERDKFLVELNRIIADLNGLVKEHLLPYLDHDLLQADYVRKKVHRFIKYCKKRRYLMEIRRFGGQEILVLNRQRILATYPAQVYRKANPIGFHANELISLGEDRIRALFDRALASSSFGRPHPTG